MGNLSNTGRIFYGLAIAGMGFPTIYYKSLPYMLLPTQHLLTTALAFIFGILIILTGACIAFKKRTRLVSLLLGCLLLLIFCLYYLPYEFMVNPNYMHLVEWDNPGKELALAGGAFVIAGCFSDKNENPANPFWRKVIPFGAILYSIPIICFGTLHFLYAKDVSTLVPLWVPGPVFWTYLAGIGLFGSGVAIILKIKPGLIAALLGTMIFTWFIILHIPRVIAAPVADLEGEVPSAFLALAYSGIAFVIAGATKKII